MTHIVIFTIMLLSACGFICYCFYQLMEYHKERAKYWYDEYIEVRNRYLEECKKKMKL